MQKLQAQDLSSSLQKALPYDNEYKTSENENWQKQEEQKRKSEEFHPELHVKIDDEDIVRYLNKQPQKNLPPFEPHNDTFFIEKTICKEEK